MVVINGTVKCADGEDETQSSLLSEQSETDLSRVGFFIWLIKEILSL